MFSLKIVKGAELAEGVRVETRLPEALTRFTVGRDPANQWPIPDRTLAISARHCELVGAGSRVLLRDLSTNGTFVNGATARLAGEHVLKDGDRIELGPYTIVVQGHGAHAAAAPAQDADVTVHLPPTTPPAPVPPVEATAPLRGGDPAAMLAAAGGAPAPKVGLTEILRNAPPAADANLAVTKIRMAPKPPPPAATQTESRPAKPEGASKATAAAPTPAPPPAAPTKPPAPPAPVRVPAAAPARPAAPVDPQLAALALGLGLPADALAGRDPAQMATQVAALARAAVGALRQLMEQQAQSRRQMGSHAPALVPVRELNPLRRAVTPEAAVLGLLAPGADVEAPLQRTAAELAAHQDRLMAAFRGAATRLGAEMSPASLEKALGANTGMAPSGRLWELYTQLWQGMGLAPGQPWSQGFLDAALLHLAAAYDEHGKP